MKWIRNAWDSLTDWFLSGFFEGELLAAPPIHWVESIDPTRLFPIRHSNPRYVTCPWCLCTCEQQLCVRHGDIWAQPFPWLATPRCEICGHMEAAIPLPSSGWSLTIRREDAGLP